MPANSAQLSGADVRQALLVGLWEALADDSDRASMRVTCRDARDMGDALHDTAVLTVGPGTWYSGVAIGPGTWYSGAAIGAYHRRLGAVRAVHVQYSGSEFDGERAKRFMAAYRTALGGELHAAAECSIALKNSRLPPAALVAWLLARVVPRVERLDVALASLDNFVQLLETMEPCTRLRSLRILPAQGTGSPALDSPTARGITLDHPGYIDALRCLGPRLHTLSAPLELDNVHLRRLCDALPSLTTLGFMQLQLPIEPRACPSARSLHTLAYWRHSVDAGMLWDRLDRPWHLQSELVERLRVCVDGGFHAALPAAQHVGALVLCTQQELPDGLPRIREAAQRFAACADRWACEVQAVLHTHLLALAGMSQGSMAAVKHLVVVIHSSKLTARGFASVLAGLVAAAPSVTTIALSCFFTRFTDSTDELEVMMRPLRRAAHLRTLWLTERHRLRNSAWQAMMLERVVRCLAEPGAEGGDRYCLALRHVLVKGAYPDALAACRSALASRGCAVSVGSFSTL